MSKGKTSFKGILFLLLIILIVGGVICAIFFWPKNPEEIKGALNEQTSKVLNTEGEFFKEYNTYGEYATNYLSVDGIAYNKYSTMKIVYTALAEYFEYMAFTFENADFSNHQIEDINNARNGMNEAKNKISSITAFLKDKNQNLTSDGYNTRVYKNADAKLVWENIQIEIRETLVCYQTATENIAKSYRTNITKGVYANEFANQVADGVSYYLDYLVNDIDNLGNAEYKIMSLRLSNFINVYLSNITERRVAKYLTSQNLQTVAADLKKFNEQFEDLTLKQLVLNKLNYDETLYNTDQLTALQNATNFYNGGIVAWKN